LGDFFSIIGSIASIGSIPLAIFLYFKSREAKFEKVGREIVRIISFQVGENRELTTFELQTVINSKLRENRIKEGSISIGEVIEDLAAETISNPLLESIRKETILNNLRKLYYKGELLAVVDEIDSNKNENLNNNLDQLKQYLEEDKTQKEYQDKKKERFTLYSNFFLIVVSLIGAILSVWTTLSDSAFINFFKPFEPLKENTVLSKIALGAVASAIALAVTSLTQSIIKKKEKKRKK
jgi:hypothetical protein